MLRAAALSVLLVVSVLKALPGEPLKPEELAQPGNARPIASVAGALATLGFSVSEGDVGEALLWTSKTWTTARRKVLKPFRTVDDALGMGQNWSLFPVRDSHAWRIRLDAMHDDQQWKMIYRAHELDPLGLESRLAYRRMRAIYNPRSKTETRNEYEPFANWLGNELLAQHPEYVGVRVSVERLKLGSRKGPSTLLSMEHPIEVYRAGTP